MISRLPFLVSRYLQIKLLDSEPEKYPFERDINPLIGIELTEDDPCTIAFDVILEGKFISDDYYKIEIQINSDVRLPKSCQVRILH